MKKRLKIFCSAILCLLWVLICCTVQAKSLEKIVAIVNDDVITQSQLDNAVFETQRQLQASHIDSQLSDAALKKRVLNNLILEYLQLQMAQRAGLTVSNADVNRAITAIAKKNNMDRQKFKAILESEGISFSEYKAQIRKQVLIARLQQEAIGPSIKVTPQDIQKFNREYALHQKNTMQYKLETIIIPFLSTTKMSINDQMNKAKALRTALQKNISVEKAAQTVYGKKIANELGLEATSLGNRSKTDLPNIFQKVVPTMHIGSYAGPIKAPNGFHILHLLGKTHQNKTLTRQQATQLIFQEKFNEALEKWLKELKASAYIKIINGSA